MERDFNKFIGRVIQIQTRDNDWYEGVVVSGTVKKKIVLENVKDSSGIIRHKRYHFFSDQISNLLCPNVPSVENVDRTASAQKEPSSSESKQSEDNLADNLHADSAMRDKREKKDAFFKDASDGGPSLLQLDPALYLSGDSPCSKFELNEPPEGLVINQLGDKFTEALNTIKQQNVISLTAEGRRINRFGDIVLIIIGTRQLVYIFDVQAIGSKCLTNGLGAILEDPNLLKVVHDIRLLSDCLHAQYNIHPKNVFDTQVADIFIQKKKYGKFPREVSTLFTCLRKYLHIPPNKCHFEKEKRKIMQTNKRLWCDRPLPEDFRNYCCQAAMYIRELRPPMIEQLLSDVLCGMDVYLNCVRGMPDHAVKYVNTRKPPKQLLNHSNSFQREKRGKNKDLAKELQDNLSDEGSGGDGSMDEETGLWGEGVAFSDKYQKKHGELVECMDSIRPLLDTSKPVLRTKGEKRADPVVETLESSIIHSEIYNENADNNSISSDWNEEEKCGIPSGNIFDQPIDNVSSQDSDEANDENFLVSNGEDTIFENTSNDFLSHLITNKVDFEASLEYPQYKLRNNIFEESSEEETKAYDEFRLSTNSETDDSEIFLTSVNDKPMRGHNNLSFEISNESSKKNGPRVSDEGKRMLIHHLFPAGTGMSRRYEKEFPTLSESFKEQKFDNSTKSNNNNNDHECSKHKYKNCDSHLDQGEIKRLENVTIADSYSEIPFESNHRFLEKKCKSTLKDIELVNETNAKFSPKFEKSNDHNSSWQRDPALCDTVEGSNIMRGVKRLDKNKIGGRGQTLQYLAERYKENPPLVFGEIGKGYDFPSDDELLQAPRIAPMIESKPMLGESVKVVNKFGPS